LSSSRPRPFKKWLRLELLLHAREKARILGRRYTRIAARLNPVLAVRSHTFKLGGGRFTFASHFIRIVLLSSRIGCGSAAHDDEFSRHDPSANHMHHLGSPFARAFLRQNVNWQMTLRPRSTHARAGTIESASLTRGRSTVGWLTAWSSSDGPNAGGTLVQSVVGGQSGSALTPGPERGWTIDFPGLTVSRLLLDFRPACKEGRCMDPLCLPHTPHSPQRWTACGRTQ